MGHAEIPGTVLDWRDWRGHYDCSAVVRAHSGAAGCPDRGGFGRGIRNSDLVWNPVRGERNHDDSVPVCHQGQIFYWNSDRCNFGPCHVWWRRRGVCRPPWRIAVRLAVRAAGAETGAGQCGVIGALLRVAEFVPSLEAAASGEKV